MSLTSNTPMNAIKGIKSCLKSTDDPVYQGLQKQIVQELMDGQPIHVALRKTEAFPAEFLDALEVGEESGASANRSTICPFNTNNGPKPPPRP